MCLYLCPIIVLKLKAKTQIPNKCPTKKLKKPFFFKKKKKKDENLCFELFKTVIFNLIFT